VGKKRTSQDTTITYGGGMRLRCRKPLPEPPDFQAMIVMSDSQWSTWILAVGLYMHYKRSCSRIGGRLGKPIRRSQLCDSTQANQRKMKDDEKNLPRNTELLLRYIHTCQ